MKKFLSIAALLCSISFASNATAHKAKDTATKKTIEVSTKIAKLAPVCYLYEMTFDCPGQGFSVQCYGRTEQEMANAYLFYQSHLAC